MRKWKPLKNLTSLWCAHNGILYTNGSSRVLSQGIQGILTNTGWCVMKEMLNSMVSDRIWSNCLICEKNTYSPEKFYISFFLHLLWQKEFKEDRVYSGSLFEGIVYHSRKIRIAESWSHWSYHDHTTNQAVNLCAKLKFPALRHLFVPHSQGSKSKV